MAKSHGRQQAEPDDATFGEKFISPGYTRSLPEGWLRNEEPVPEPGVETNFWGDARTLDKVLAMSPDEFRRWTTFVQRRRTIGDD